jgi:collagenase-like PrtC family protease
MSEISFSVATNFDDRLIDGLAGYPVKELFGKLSRDPIGGGRASFMLPDTGKRAFRRHVRKAREAGIGFNYLVNPACMDNMEHTRRGLSRLESVVGFARDAGATAVTISLPSILPFIKDRFPEMNVRVGVYARVDSVPKARYWEGLGADCITLESISVNRDFGTLRAIRESVGIELQLIANSNCMLFCPLSGQHMVNLSHASQKGHASGGFMVDWCVLKCSCDKLRDPANYLRSEFIRPEDMDRFIRMGYTSYKILERGAPTGVLVGRVKAYAERKYSGNLLDLVQPFGYKGKSESRPAFWRYMLRPFKASAKGLLKLKELARMRGMLSPLDGEPVYLDNGMLDGYMDGFAGRDCRATDCDSCGHCERYAKLAVRIDEDYRAKLLGMYDEALGDMASGRFYKGL